MNHVKHVQILYQLVIAKIQRNERAYQFDICKILVFSGSQPSRINISIDQIQSTAVPAVRLSVSFPTSPLFSKIAEELWRVAHLFSK